jgi:chromosomal replication initiation ATPase DnaA
MEKNIKSFGEEVNKNLPPSPYIVPGLGVKTLQTYTLQDILEAVCKALNVTAEEIYAKTSKRNIALARQIAHYFSHYYTKYTKTAIGKFFRRKQETIGYSVRSIEGFIDTRQYLDEISSVDKELRKKLK